MGNTSTVPEAGSEMADLDKFIINVTFCDCKCKLSISTDRLGERTEELEIITEPDTLDQEEVGETVKDDQANTEKLNSFKDLIPETLVCGTIIKDDNEKRKIEQEDKEDLEKTKDLSDDHQEINENEPEAENNSSSGYGSPEFSDKEE